MKPHVKPEHFFGDRPPERIIGVECEYNMQGVFDAEGNELSSLTYINPMAVQAAGLKQIGTFLDNGAKLYPDVGHLEYSTQECLGPAEATAADLAGPDILAGIVEASGLPHRGLYRISGSDTAIGSKGRTSGYHENYLTADSVADSPYVDTVLPAFAASCIWGLSGMVREGYVFSQKVWGVDGYPITRKYERQTGNAKPMFIIRRGGSDVDTVGHPDYARVERRYADPGQSPEARFLQFASMSLVIRMVEHSDKIGAKRLGRVQLKNPVEAAKLFASDLSLQKTAVTTEGQDVTAQDLQEELISIAYYLDERVQLPEEESRAIPLWDAVVHKFRHCNPAAVEYGGLIATLDVAARHAALARSLGGSHHLNKTNKEAVKASLVWDRILPIGSAKLWWQQFSSTHVPREKIEAFRRGEALPRTRAAIRIRELRQNYDLISSLNWAQINYHSSKPVRLYDFYATD